MSRIKDAIKQFKDFKNLKMFSDTIYIPSFPNNILIKLTNDPVVFEVIYTDLNFI
jgi:hypothetical protein